MKSRLIPVLLLLLCILSAPASSEIYQWKDSKGNTIFTDAPPAGVDAREKRVREDRIERPEVEVKEETLTPKPTTSQPSTIKKRPYEDIKVVMYMTAWCPYCRKAREFIRSTGVSLNEYDIDKDKEKGREMVKRSGGKGVPLIDVEGILIRGYTPDAIRDAIEKRRSS